MSKQQEITKNDQAAFKKNQTKLLDENIMMEKKNQCLEQLEYRFEKITQNGAKRRQKGGGQGRRRSC